MKLDISYTAKYKFLIENIHEGYAYHGYLKLFSAHRIRKHLFVIQGIIILNQIL